MPGLALPPLNAAPPPVAAGERILRWGLVAALHLGLGWAALQASVASGLVELPPTLAVRLLPAVEARKPEPPPPPPKLTPLPRKAPAARQPAPAPVLAAKADVPAPGAFTVAPQPPAAPAAVAAPAAPPAPPAVTPPRFDADYLHNPRPAYPSVSRRNGEEGKVLLRVRVSPEGTALSVEVKESSGFARLDAAAREVVAKWRFVPARRGDEPIESAVVVPINFSLD